MFTALAPATLALPDLSSASVAVGAFLGAALSIFTSEAIKFAIARRTKRDTLRLDGLTEATVAVSDAARTMLHIAGSTGAVTDDLAGLKSAHQSLRIGLARLQMLAGPGVQTAAYLVRHHLYAIRKIAEGADDPFPLHELSAYKRAEQSIEYLLEEARKEIGVSGRVVAKPDVYALTRSVTAKRDSAPMSSFK
ncbi:hypothetical protein [Microbacterium sp. Leaf159]|uniref:hypothetical protein n=1 Tax=Microbacterium sp. Leaf159 TaxID=1736279 RepID=UPI000700C494|nr:hypothetical protein [Microbacterium sp. Leaf159]KQR39764.1 hypothetical protein ASF80_10370 [Microbacterium sp. Leaf159]